MFNFESCSCENAKCFSKLYFKRQVKRNTGDKIDYLICTILYDVLMNSAYTVSMKCLIVNSELEGVWKEAVVD